MTELQVFQYAVEQGPMFLLMCVILWVLRRDTMSRERRDIERLDVMTGIAERSIAAQERITAAVVALEKSQHQIESALGALKEVVAALNTSLSRDRLSQR